MADIQAVQDSKASAVTFLRLLVKIRESMKVSQAELGRRMKIAQASVSQMEKSVNPSLALVIRYADALQVPLAVMVQLDDDVISFQLSG